MSETPQGAHIFTVDVEDWFQVECPGALGAAEPG